MVSLDPELSIPFLVLISTFGSQNASTFPNFPKRKLETSFLHFSQESKSLRFFPDKLLFLSQIFQTTRSCSLQLLHILFSHKDQKIFFQFQKLRPRVFERSTRLEGMALQSEVVTSFFFRPIVYKKPNLTLYHKLYHSALGKNNIE